MIIAFSGKKQAGKDTACAYCLGTLMWQNGMIQESYAINDDGKLVISDMFGNTNLRGILDVRADVPGQDEFLTDNEVYSLCRIYSMADQLKHICVNILGIDRDGCFGTDKDKMKESHLRWEDMPGVITDIDLYSHAEALNMITHEPGPMTNREVLQFVGTNIFRKMFGEVWTNSTLTKIKQDASDFALISDVRFPNEVEAVQKAGGIVIRLTRNVLNDDHPSETMLDDYIGFDYIIENHDMDIRQQNEAIMEVLLSCGVPLCT